tara:strand:- start:74 stop:409 length:336 start_codon:yes stop_codon:yes gene_type:complete
MRSLSVPILKQSKIIQSTNEEQQIVKPQPEISKPSKPVAKQNKINKNEQDQTEEPKPDKSIEENPKNLNVEESSNNPKPKENPPEVIEVDPVNKPTLKPKLPEREGVLPPK